ncbi:MAG: hypothetical protein C5B55_02420 [Blastocatellia bacterium]|nr:MAG: hypothetical protein C5B55_02420 [Blastocatellia bacterium]
MRTFLSSTAIMLISVAITSVANMCNSLDAPTLGKDDWNERPNLVANVVQTEEQQKNSTDLSGTSWQLVRFQGGVEKTLTPDDASKYTISFGADGRVTARIDCNRGIGTWKSSGRNQIRFGPLALTRAMCPQGSLHDQIARHWSLVRSYIIKNGHLFLSLKADGGIYEFEPLVSTSSLAREKWELIEVNGASVQRSKAYIQFDENTKRFSGSGGCNRIAGGYEVDGSHIRFLQTVMTRMACLDNEVQRVETEFLKALNDATDFQIQNNVLRIFKGNQQIMTFNAKTE